MNLVDIYNANPEFIRQLGGFRMIETNKLVGSADAEGNTLLHKAAMNNDMTTFNSVRATLPENAQECARFLNTQNTNGDTAAHIAVRNGNYAMVTAMKQLGADLSIANKNQEYIMSTESSENVFEQKQSGGGIDSDRLPAALSSTEPYVAPQMPKFESPAFNSPANLDVFSSDIFISNKTGGAATNSDAYDPETLSEISSDFNMMRGGSVAKQSGGAGKSINGTRTLYFEDMLTSDSSMAMYHEGGKAEKDSSKIHNDVIQMIQDLGYSEEDARVLKAGCYRLVKDKYPDLNNLERAKKMLEICKSDLIATMPIDEIRDAINKNREAKAAMKGKTAKSPKTEKKASAKKTTAKKATAKKTSAKKSKK